MANAFRSVLASSGGEISVDSLEITTPASKTIFNVGETFNTSGLVVTGSVGGLTGDVTSECTITPPSTIFTSEDIGYHDIPINYYGTIITYQIRVRQGVDIVPWATGTDKQILDMINAYYNGELSFDDIEGWDVGAERTVQLSAMSATDVSESHASQQATFVILHKGGIDLTTPINGISKCAFVIGMKNCLTTSTSGETGYIDSDSSLTNYVNSKRRTWCNNVFRNAIPSTLKECFKQFKNPMYNGSTVVTYDDYFTLPSSTELGQTNGVTEGFQFSYYSNASKCIKQWGDGTSLVNREYFVRTPNISTAGRWCTVTNTGVVINYVLYCSSKTGITVQGVI